MGLTIEQQAIAALVKTNKPLIVFRKHFSGDALAGALALNLILQKMGKLPDVVCDGFILPKGYKFLPGNENVKPTLETLRRMIISIDKNKIKQDEFHYDTDGEQLKIFLSPQNEFFGPQDVRASISDWRYDQIIIIDTPDLESLGDVFSKNREFFFRRPILNIDYSPANEQYGQINFIDMTSSSTCGVLYNLIKSWNEKLFSPDVNTCLLTGIIDKTKSFKAGMINPYTLQISSDLIKNEARREEIVKNLYYSRDVATLKLWGQTLTKLKEHYGGKLITATISEQDFADTKTDGSALPDIIDELLSAVPNVDVAILLYHLDNLNIGVFARSLGSTDLQKALTEFIPIGDKNFVRFKIAGNDLVLAEEKVVSVFKQSYEPKF
ncbi:MAG: hypothetical protein WC310_00335 [Patescibacteria group bacterium]|jgi:nanoRNase/pAp phosphatase (c-di-AMP/oligoRNAs hydrolase)